MYFNNFLYEKNQLDLIEFLAILKNNLVEFLLLLPLQAIEIHYEIVSTLKSL